MCVHLLNVFTVHLPRCLVYNTAHDILDLAMHFTSTTSSLANEQKVIVAVIFNIFVLILNLTGLLNVICIYCIHNWRAIKCNGIV